MNRLNVAVLHNDHSDLQHLVDFSAHESNFKFQHFTNDETLLEASSAQQFDLLIIEKSLDNNVIKKVEKLIDILHPNAATTIMDFTDPTYIAYKLNALYNAWIAANNNNSIFYHDVQLN